MTYTPTEQELIEMGFEKVKNRGNEWIFNLDEGFVLTTSIQCFWIDAKCSEYDHEARLYPSYKSDIETFIRLFTK